MIDPADELIEIVEEITEMGERPNLTIVPSHGETDEQ